MSVVACQVKPGGRWTMAADSICVRGWTQRKMDGQKQTKLFKINGVVVGGTGELEELNLLRIFAATHLPSRCDVDGILDWVVEFAEWKKSKIEKFPIANSYLIGYGSKAFDVSGFCISEIERFEAIGAGMDFALAALHLGHHPARAVETAIELSAFCEGPVIEYNGSGDDPARLGG